MECRPVCYRIRFAHNVKGTCRSAMSPEKLISRFPPPDEEIRTLYDVLERSVRQFGKVLSITLKRVRNGCKDNRLHSWGHVRSDRMGATVLTCGFLTQKCDPSGIQRVTDHRAFQAASIRTEIGSGLLHLGLKAGSTVGVFSINCEGSCAFSHFSFSKE